MTIDEIMGDAVTALDELWQEPAEIAEEYQSFLRYMREEEQRDEDGDESGCELPATEPEPGLAELIQRLVRQFGGVGDVGRYDVVANTGGALLLDYGGRSGRAGAFGPRRRAAAAPLSPTSRFLSCLECAPLVVPVFGGSIWRATRLTAAELDEVDALWESKMNERKSSRQPDGDPAQSSRGRW